jgi:hypothetical protein
MLIATGAQAHEKTDKLELAFQDAANAARLDPKNKAAVSLAHSLMQRVSSKRDLKMSTKGIGDDIVDLALKGDTPAKRKQGAANVAAFAQDEPGAEDLFRKGLHRLLPLLKSDDKDVVDAALHAFAAVRGVLASITVLSNARTLLTHTHTHTHTHTRARARTFLSACTPCHELPYARMLLTIADTCTHTLLGCDKLCSARVCGACHGGWARRRWSVQQDCAIKGRKDDTRGPDGAVLRPRVLQRGGRGP